MTATILLDKKKHYPVLLKEIISIISPQYGGTFIDCTFGEGGYSKKILESSNTKVIALDRDIETNNKVISFQKRFENRFFFKNIKFSQINNLKLKNENIKGVIFDLGYSYSQIKDNKKGLSFESTGDLDMRMGINDFSAKDVINKFDEKDLIKIFKYFGEEKESKRIAYKIIKKRELKEIDTQGLVKIIESSKRKKNYKTHSATKVFQALRIFVNKEISELIYGLINATKVVKKNGVIVVVSFHSIEDKIVKYFFKSLSENKSVSRYLPKNKEKIKLLKLKNKKLIIPSTKEIEENPPSRSAKLRYAIKQEDFYDFKSDILDKFNYLLEIENLSKKI
jgi:16S rRNA (cytosine1402-N4)-methyltransferase